MVLIQLELGDVEIDDGAQVFAGDEAAGGGEEFAVEVLAEEERVHAALQVEVFGGDLGAIEDGGEDAGPGEFAGMPVGVEEAGLAAGSGEHPDGAAGAGDDGGDGG